MANQSIESILQRLKEKFGELRRIGNGYSLYWIASLDTYIYFRYSKLSQVSKTTQRAFYGLRQEDIKKLFGQKSFICFVWDRPDSPILLPFADFESYFTVVQPSNDGQYKTLLYIKPTGTEIYFSNIGKFNVDVFYGLDRIFNNQPTELVLPELSHTQVQTMIGCIGASKGYQIWYPESDKARIDYNVFDQKSLLQQLPTFHPVVDEIIAEIDVIWWQAGKAISFWEVEHSTPIYSGLLRFNDVLLTIAGVDNFNIVAKSEREAKFTREINRPTFKQNRLIEKVTFVSYAHIYRWFQNLRGARL